MTEGECLVCGELSGAVAVPGGPVYEDEHVVAIHLPPTEQGARRPYRGHLLVLARRHAAKLGDLEPDEAAAVGRAAARLADALEETAGAEWVYAAVIGHGVAHFHLHLVPRYQETPPEVPWHSVDEWEGGPHLSPPEIAELAERLRRAVQSRPASAAN